MTSQQYEASIFACGLAETNPCCSQLLRARLPCTTADVSGSTHSAVSACRSPAAEGGAYTAGSSGGLAAATDAAGAAPTGAGAVAGCCCCEGAAASASLSAPPR